MASLSPRPSTRLLRAAAAERAELEKHRDRILRERDSLRAELERIEDSLAEVEDRRRLLDRLAPADQTTTDAPDGQDLSNAQPGHQLRGPAIRETAVRLLAEHHETDAMHYRDWFGLLMAAGYQVAGKDPLAVFLTQISRSPAVRKGTQSGVYELDRRAPQRLRAQLERLHVEMREFTGMPTAKADVSAIRARRAQLTSEIAQIEKAQEEVARVLDPAINEPAVAASTR